MRRTENGHVARALSVAGSDSGGGAGIQADLKTFAAFDVYGSSVLTAVTAQNTLGVQGVQYIDSNFVRLQLTSVLDDIGADAVKTGMLGSQEIVRSVAAELRSRCVANLVVDPVMIAKGGQPLIDDDATRTVAEELFPMASVITPNIPEAEVLCEFEIQSFRDCERAAKTLYEQGASCVVVKGGHAQMRWLHDTQWSRVTELDNMSIDVVYDGRDFTYFASERIDTGKTHGTGCTYSSAITASLAKGERVLDAIAAAKAFIQQAIESARTWDVGAGHGPTDHSVKPITTPGITAGKLYVVRQESWDEYA